MGACLNETCGHLFVNMWVSLWQFKNCFEAKIIIMIITIIIIIYLFKADIQAKILS